MASSTCKPFLPAAEAMAGLFPPLPPGTDDDDSHFLGHEEPALTEILQDPIFRRLMASDGVRHDHLLGIIADARARLGN